ncbi:TetR/AcrR family transcriptional regulator [Nonomuraea mangrovi]|uniref:TetR/AcrR family transcriptional regulator n=1 Tax=Nonomuraea mangrovi TaxID=2316207 RepID=A0ABW4T5M2_9ACTN
MRAAGRTGSTDLDAVADLLWRAGDERADDGRVRLSARLIVEAAVTIADAEGLDALSMQRVASVLGYTSMALYRHVPGKDQLVAAMTDVATGRPPAPTSPPPSWRAEIESWVDAVWEVYLRHPWLVRVPTNSAPVGPNELAWLEALLGPLSRAGLDRAELIPMATFISGAVRGLARAATELDPAAAAAYGQVLARHVDPGRFPVLSSLMAEDGLVEDDGGDLTPSVHHGMNRLLDGIEALRDRRSTQRKGT